jgi:hypothetical protein
MTRAHRHQIEQEAGDLVVVPIQRQPGYLGAAVPQTPGPLQEQRRLAEAGGRGNDRELSQNAVVELRKEARPLDTLRPFRRNSNLGPNNV